MGTSQPRNSDPDGPVLASAESELLARFPEVPGGVIHGLVVDSYRHLTPAKVHTYLPILIARSVRTQLRTRPVTRATQHSV